MFYYDWTIVLLIPAMIVAAWAQSRVKSTYNKYSKYATQRGWTGAAIARKILDDNGLNYVDVEISQSQGLSDHYDPKARAVRLSNDVYHSTSMAALGIAAHEVGHAIQHSEEYAPLTIRNAIIPATNIGSKMVFPLILIGLLFSIPQIAFLGVIAFALSVVFQLLTLPVEFDASNRALAILGNGTYMTEEEVAGSKKVLNAAAMTYVAALFVAVMQLVRLMLIARGSRRD